MDSASFQGPTQSYSISYSYHDNLAASPFFCIPDFPGSLLALCYHFISMHDLITQINRSSFITQKNNTLDVRKFLRILKFLLCFHIFLLEDFTNGS